MVDNGVIECILKQKLRSGLKGFREAYRIIDKGRGMRKTGLDVFGGWQDVFVDCISGKG